MKTIDVQDELQDDFEVGALPPIGPDGAPEIPALRKMTAPPPRLCEAGPCRNYHRLAIQMDVTRPIAGALEPGGKLVGEAPPQPFFVQVHHYCYPSPGIETQLGDLPVMECNRWEPRSGMEAEQDHERHAAFMRSAAGERYKTALDTWLEEQKSTQDIAVAASSIEGKEHQ